MKEKLTMTNQTFPFALRTKFNFSVLWRVDESSLCAHQIAVINKYTGKKPRQLYYEHESKQLIFASVHRYVYAMYTYKHGIKQSENINSPLWFSLCDWTNGVLFTLWWLPRPRAFRLVSGRSCYSRPIWLNPNHFAFQTHTWVQYILCMH